MTTTSRSEYVGIPETVSPEGLRVRAHGIRNTDPSCSRHLELAADRIQQLEAAITIVLRSFTGDEAQGYKSRDRQFAIAILERAYNARFGAV